MSMRTITPGSLVKLTVPRASRTVGIVASIHENDYGVFYNVMVHGELFTVGEHELQEITDKFEVDNVDTKP